MRVEDGWAHFIQLFHEVFSGGNGFSQNRIDERADGSFACFDRFVHRCVIRDIEDEKLAETDAEDIARFGIEFALAEFSYPMIEKAAMAEDSEEDCLKERTVCRG